VHEWKKKAEDLEEKARELEGRALCQERWDEYPAARNDPGPVLVYGFPHDEIED
jgi:hypothetical protein